MRLRILLAGACALVALGAFAGSASAAVPYGPFYMIANPAEPAGSAVTLELPYANTFTCKSSSVEGTHQAGSGTTLPWTVTSMKFLSCGQPRIPAEATITVPVMPKMVVTAGTSTKVSFTEFKPMIKIFGCEAQLSGTFAGTGAGNPSSSEAFTATSSTLTVAKANSYCNSVLGISAGQKATMTTTYNNATTPIGS